MRRNITDRFFEKVNKDGPVSPYTGTTCWLWGAGVFKSGGYGAFCYEKGDVRRAHVLSYELLVGPVPPGLCVRHACHEPRCVNPAHLSVGTDKDNHDDAVRAGRSVPPPRLSGSRNPQSKLTEEQAREIRASTESGPVLARRYGIDHVVIYRIRSRKAWKNA